jgi:hypothetical protein
MRLLRPQVANRERNPMRYIWITGVAILAVAGTSLATTSGVLGDCNENGVDDLVDIQSGASTDCDNDSIPDECQNDCDDNGISDGCEILQGASDENMNGVPDSCDPDCNENLIPDFLEIQVGLADDCDGNWVPDECDHSSVANITPEEYLAIYFGSVVDLEEDHLVIGMPNWNGSRGIVTIYQIDATPGVEINRAVCHLWGSQDYGDLFGTSVAISGSTIAVGESGSPNNDGRVYIFEQVGDTQEWALADVIESPIGGGYSFGSCLDIDGDNLVVSTFRSGIHSPTYLYERQPEGGWKNTISFLHTSTTDKFVSLSGDKFVVGASGLWTYIYSQSADGDWSGVSITPAVGGTAISGSWAVVHHHEWLRMYFQAANGLWAQDQDVDITDITGDAMAVEIDVPYMTAISSSGIVHVYELKADRVWARVDEFSIPGITDPSAGTAALSGNSLAVATPQDVVQQGGLGSVSVFELRFDCNGNNVPDSCDLDELTSLDINSDGHPDECQCLADINDSGAVDVDDALLVLSLWGQVTDVADIDYDGFVGVNDLLALLAAWGPCS